MESDSPEEILKEIPREESQADLFTIEDDRKSGNPYIFLGFTVEENPEYPLRFVLIPSGITTSQELLKSLSFNPLYKLSQTRVKETLTKFTVVDPIDRLRGKESFTFLQTGLALKGHELFVAEPTV